MFIYQPTSINLSYLAKIFIKIAPRDGSQISTNNIIAEDTAWIPVLCLFHDWVLKMIFENDWILVIFALVDGYTPRYWLQSLE